MTLLRCFGLTVLLAGVTRLDRERRQLGPVGRRGRRRVGWGSHRRVRRQVVTVTLRGDSGIRGYYGPNPPAGHGPHRYLFAIHAVDVDRLDIPADATPTVLGFNLYYHSLARAVYWGWYRND